MTALAYNAIGFILAENGHYPEAAQYSNQALALSQSPDFSIKLMCRQAYISNEIGDYESACETCEKAFAFALSESAKIEADDIKKTLKTRVAWTYQEYATALLALKKYPEAIKAWDCVLADEFTTSVFNSLLECYAAAGDYQGFIDRAKSLDRGQRAEWMISNLDYDTDKRDFQHAAKATDGRDILVQAHREAIEAPKDWPSDAEFYEIHARFRLAHAFWRIFDDEDAAYRELDNVYNILYQDDVSENNSESSEDDFFTVAECEGERAFLRAHFQQDPCVSREMGKAFTASRSRKSGETSDGRQG